MIQEWGVWSNKVTCRCSLGYGKSLEYGRSLGYGSLLRRDGTETTAGIDRAKRDGVADG